MSEGSEDVRVTTESGAVYEIDGMRVRRTASVTNLRRDGEWLTLLEAPVIVVGEPMRLVLEPLASDAICTERVTTLVTERSAPCMTSR